MSIIQVINNTKNKNIENKTSTNNKKISNFLLNITQFINQIVKSKCIKQFSRENTLKILIVFCNFFLLIDKIIPEFTALIAEIWKLILEFFYFLAFF